MSVRKRGKGRYTCLDEMSLHDISRVHGRLAEKYHSLVKLTRIAKRSGNDALAQRLYETGLRTFNRAMKVYAMGEELER